MGRKLEAVTQGSEFRAGSEEMDGKIESTVVLGITSQGLVIIVIGTVVKVITVIIVIRILIAVIAVTVKIGRHSGVEIEELLQVED